MAGMNPILHYVEHGLREDRAPNPWFDPVWYRATHRLPPGDIPLFHYASGGEAGDLRPSPNFDPSWYRATYKLGVHRSPLADFLRRRIKHKQAAGDPVGALDEAVRLAKSAAADYLPGWCGPVTRG